MTNIHDGTVLIPNEKVIISDTLKETVIESEMKTKTVSDSTPISGEKVMDSTSTHPCPSEIKLESNTPAHRKEEVNKTTIEGQIINTSGLPIASAWVGLYSTTNEIAEVLAATTYTDKYGYYNFNNIAAGEYTIKSKALFL